LVGADVLVAGALQRAALIADGGGCDAGDGGEGGFNAPEAAGSECGFFDTLLMDDEMLEDGSE
jgi:hypothetical protein